MARRKLWNNTWTFVLIFSVVLSFALARPSVDTVQNVSNVTNKEASADTKIAEDPVRSINENETKITAATTQLPPTNSPRDVKNVTPVIGESIKVVASQLLHPSNTPDEKLEVDDSRMPPKIKNQTAKNKTKTKPEINKDKIENSHAGVAVPVTIEELEKSAYFHEPSKESSTSNEGISTWILLSNPSSTTKAPKSDKSEIKTDGEEPQKKPKPNNQKNKQKKPQINANKPTVSKRPIIASTNKSDLVAGGSVMNENMFNKIKATVLANVQKNKNAANSRLPITTTIPSTILTTTTSSPTTKKDIVTKLPATSVTVELNTVTEKTMKQKKKKKKNKNKNKTNLVINSESASLPMEAKEQEIELEVSTPPTTTKKPKRTSNKRKKNKTKTRKPTTNIVKVEASETSQTKVKNSTKVAKPTKTNQISTQIYNYLSREVMPTVGVGIVGLAGLVGLASYFLYPFASPVRRVFEVDKKDDLYRHNAEEYAHDGNGQPEEEMLGTVLAGMPAKTNRLSPLNPYVNQTPVRQQTKKESDQNLRYRHVSSHSDSNNYNTHYSQSKTGIAHGAYSDPVSYPHYESKNVYSPEKKHSVYGNENQHTYSTYSQMAPQNYSPVEPVYAAPQTAPSGPTSYGNDPSNGVVYGIKPTQGSNFEPVYPFEGQVFSETTNFPMTYPPTSMYLGSNNESENEKESVFSAVDKTNDKKEPQFVVGNVPEEFLQTVTPAVVPEHGPRNIRKKRSLTTTLEEILKKEREENKDNFISNEIDEALGIKPEENVVSHSHNIVPITTTTTFMTETEVMSTNIPTTEVKLEINERSTQLYPVYTFSPTDKENKNNDDGSKMTTENTKTENEIVESISTVPIYNSDNDELKITTEVYGTNDVELTTKTFRVYEVFPSSPNSLLHAVPAKTVATSEQTPTLTANVVESAENPSIVVTSSSTLPPEMSSTTSAPITEKTVKSSTPNYNTSTVGLTYPKTSIFKFIKDLFEFKYRLGMSVLQATSESLNRYLRRMDGTLKKMATASQGQR